MSVVLLGSKVLKIVFLSIIMLYLALLFLAPNFQLLSSPICPDLQPPTIRLLDKYANNGKIVLDVEIDEGNDPSIYSPEASVFIVHNDDTAYWGYGYGISYDDATKRYFEDNLYPKLLLRIRDGKHVSSAYEVKVERLGDKIYEITVNTSFGIDINKIRGIYVSVRVRDQYKNYAWVFYDVSYLATRILNFTPSRERLPEDVIIPMNDMYTKGLYLNRMLEGFITVKYYRYRGFNYIPTYNPQVISNIKTIYNRFMLVMFPLGKEIYIGEPIDLWLDPNASYAGIMIVRYDRLWSKLTLELDIDGNKGYILFLIDCDILISILYVPLFFIPFELFLLPKLYEKQSKAHARQRFYHFLSVSIMTYTIGAFLMMYGGHLHYFIPIALFLADVCLLAIAELRLLNFSPTWLLSMSPICSLFILFSIAMPPSNDFLLIMSVSYFSSPAPIILSIITAVMLRIIHIKRNVFQQKIEITIYERSCGQKGRIALIPLISLFAGFGSYISTCIIYVTLVLSILILFYAADLPSESKISAYENYRRYCQLLRTMAITVFLLLIAILVVLVTIVALVIIPLIMRRFISIEKMFGEIEKIKSDENYYQKRTSNSSVS